MQGVDSAQDVRVDSRDKAAWPPYHWLESPEIKPVADKFWRVRYDDNDLAMYNRFLEILRLSRRGLNGDETGRELHMNNVRKFLTGSKKSFLTHLRSEFDGLGPPRRGCRWLPLRLKPKGLPDKEWIEVPDEIKGIDDLYFVLNQLTPTEESYSIMQEFGFDPKTQLVQDKANQLGFLMGTMLGDAGKDFRGEVRFPSTKISLVLSKAKENSQRFGNFASLTVNSSLGLRMHRIRDAPASVKRYSKSDCFQWLAPTSPLFAWIFEVMMGLDRHELTTYDPLKADWLLSCPPSFIVSFLQGLAESDGWVNPGRDVIIIVASPNEKLLDKLLARLEIPHQFEKQKVNIVVFPTSEGLKLPVFNSRVNSNNYENMVTMATAKRFPERSPLPAWFLERIDRILTNCQNYDKACLDIARETGYKISNQTVKKYATLRTRRTTASG